MSFYEIRAKRMLEEQRRRLQQFAGTSVEFWQDPREQNVRDYTQNYRYTRQYVS